MDIGNFLCIDMEMKTIIDIYVLQIISNVGDCAQISPRETIAYIPTTNTYVAITLDWILRIISNQSILSSSITIDDNGKDKRVYCLNPISKYLVYDKDGVSLAPLVLMNQDKALMECWYYLKVIFLGIEPFTKDHGVN
eukprot:Gb_30327 [translate_table: standard]